jgi:hypothetical protein
MHQSGKKPDRCTGLEKEMIQAVPKSKRTFHRTGLAKLAARCEMRQGPMDAQTSPAVTCRDGGPARGRKSRPSAPIGSPPGRAPLSSHKANLVLPGAARTGREACSHGRRIHSGRCFASLEQ